MSIVGILASNLFASAAAQSARNSQSLSGGSANFQQLKAEFQQLGQDLGAGDLTEARQDYAAISQNLPGANQVNATQQDAEQNVQQGVGHRRHHAFAVQNAGSAQQNNPIAQAFNTLARDLQAGNLSGAQLAFATLQNDLQQVGGFAPVNTNAVSGVASPPASGNLNVTV